MKQLYKLHLFTFDLNPDLMRSIDQCSVFFQGTRFTNFEHKIGVSSAEHSCTCKTMANLCNNKKYNHLPTVQTDPVQPAAHIQAKEVELSAKVTFMQAPPLEHGGGLLAHGSVLVIAKNKFR